ncbi:hypothetical protein [Colwellia echini]|uniref:PKD domain-containing protein n=1 Tax=Colwellia echini TaxID=1982103 RepID=A0ABY3MV14_9GAMM|nr:hypothetical protein [Colwellia echini]TYK65045.1 hypothetical protein CWS31_012165 [Colwellia echini]
MKNLSSLRMCLVPFFALSMSLLTACSGSDSSTPIDTTTPTVTYTELPSFMAVDEGDTVTLSLNTSGDGAEDISFIWQVSDDIDFTGQGSDTITFTAPATDNFTSISVQVDVDSSVSKTFGFSRELTSVNVSSIENITENKGISPDINLPTVPALNFEAITEGSTWYSELELAIEKQPIALERF